TAIEPFRVEISQAALDAERRQAMSFSISTLLIRNLHDVFGENDPARRRAAIDEIFTEDCVFYEPKGVHRGRDEIDRVAGAIRATPPDFRSHPISEADEWGNVGRSQWVSGPPGEAPAYAGTDFIIARDGRIAALYLFFDELPRAGVTMDPIEVLTSQLIFGTKRIQGWLAGIPTDSEDTLR